MGCIMLNLEFWGNEIHLQFSGVKSDLTRIQFQILNLGFWCNGMNLPYSGARQLFS